MQHQLALHLLALALIALYLRVLYLLGHNLLEVEIDRFFLNNCARNAYKFTLIQRRA